MRAAALALLGLALPPAAASAQLGDLYGKAWLRVNEPTAAETKVELPLVEVSGQAGARGLRSQDVVLAIDLSDSTLEPCGIDLDGDGESGTTSPGMRDWLRRQPDVRERLLDRVERQDFDDSVLMAELTAAYAIVRQMDVAGLRIGVVAFSNHSFVVAPVGTPRDGLVEALDHLRWNFFYDIGGTDFAQALHVAQNALDKAPPGRPAPDGAPPERSIVFLSDGAATGGRPLWDVEQSVLEAARAAAADGIRLHSYALGPEAVQELDVYKGIAELGGGRFEKLDRPTDAVARMRAIDFAEVAQLEVENLTTGGAARALRNFGDGSFDALVELAPGPNRVRFTARASNGTSEVAERVVDYEKPPLQTAADQEAERQRMAALADQLRRRTAETRLVAEMGNRRPVQRREIEVRAEASRRAIAPSASPAPAPAQAAEPTTPEVAAPPAR